MSNGISQAIDGIANDFLAKRKEARSWKNEPAYQQALSLLGLETGKTAQVFFNELKKIAKVNPEAFLNGFIFETNPREIAMRVISAVKSKDLREHVLANEYLVMVCKKLARLVADDRLIFSWQYDEGDMYDPSQAYINVKLNLARVKAVLKKN